MTSFLMLLLLLCSSQGSWAANQEPWRVQFGGYYLAPDIHAGVPGIANTTTALSGDFSPGGAVSFGLTDHVRIETFISAPFELTASASGILATEQDLVTLRVLGPTVLVQWFWRTPADSWRPFVGLGATYAIFYDEQPTSRFIELGGEDAGADFDNALSLAFQGGIEVPINQHWFVVTSATFVDPDTDIAVRTLAGTASSHADIDAWALSLAFGRSF